MLYNKIETWLALMASRYPGLTFWKFDKSRFIEDNIGHYVSIVPITNDKNGVSSIKINDGVLTIKNSYYIIWRLPSLDENILRDVVRETYGSGATPISVTTDIEYLTRKLYGDPMYFPGGDRTFVAIEVELDQIIILTKNPCECLMSCLL